MLINNNNIKWIKRLIQQIKYQKSTVKDQRLLTFNTEKEV